MANPPKILDQLLETRERQHDEERGDGKARVDDGGLRDHGDAGAEEEEKVGRLAKLLKEEPRQEIDHRVLGRRDGIMGKLEIVRTITIDVERSQRLRRLGVLPTRRRRSLGQTEDDREKQREQRERTVVRTYAKDSSWRASS